ncbi:PaaI family thioesterase [Sporichthya polymorpha]|uniref:PaaI family thioesterase n=1 Tax=Sporichthya polymorpha TaxID=35751 RepID=UPI00036180D1|nr:PaaI family thioesterase [Sporichthya polymorpha]
MSFGSRSGLQVLLDWIDGDYEHSMANTLSFWPVEAEVGRVVWEGRPDERHLSSRGAVHGGYLAAFLDSVTGSAIASHLEQGVDCVTLDLAVKMIRPVAAGTLLRAEGRSLSVTRRVGSSAATVTDPDGRVIGHGTATMIITRPS